MGGRRGSISFAAAAVLPLQSQMQGSQGTAHSLAAAAQTFPFTALCDGNPQCVSGLSRGKGSVKEEAVTPWEDGVSLVRAGATPQCGHISPHTYFGDCSAQLSKPEELCPQQPRRSVIWHLHALQIFLLTSSSSEIQTKLYALIWTNLPQAASQRHPSHMSPRAQRSPNDHSLAFSRK